MSSMFLLSYEITTLFCTKRVYKEFDDYFDLASFKYNCLNDKELSSCKIYQLVVRNF